MYIDLLQIQRFSFLKFLQNGINQVFDNINPIIIANRKYVFFSKYYLLKIPSQIDFISINNQLKSPKIVDKSFNFLNSDSIFETLFSNLSYNKSSQIKSNSSYLRSGFYFSMSNVKLARWIKMSGLPSLRKYDFEKPFYDRNKTKLFKYDDTISSYFSNSFFRLQETPCSPVNKRLTNIFGCSNSDFACGFSAKLITSTQDKTFKAMERLPILKNPLKVITILRKNKYKYPSQNHPLFSSFYQPSKIKLIGVYKTTPNFIKPWISVCFNQQQFSYGPEVYKRINKVKPIVNTSNNAILFKNIFLNTFPLYKQKFEQLFGFVIKNFKNDGPLNYYPKFSIKNKTSNFSLKPNDTLLREVNSINQWSVVRQIEEDQWSVLNKTINNSNINTNLSKTSNLTYSSEFYIPVQIIDQISKKMYLRWLLLADLPIQTKRGHFIINGYPKTVIHQIVRSPGIRFKNEDNQILADIISMRGAWMGIQIVYEKNVKAATFGFKRQNKITNKPMFSRSFNNLPSSTRIDQDLININKNRKNGYNNNQKSTGLTLPGNFFPQSSKYQYQAKFIQDNIIESEKIDYLPAPKLNLLKETKQENKILEKNYWPKAFYDSQLTTEKKSANFFKADSWTGDEEKNYWPNKAKILTPRRFKFPLNSIKESEKIHEALSINFFISSSRTDKTEKKRIKLSGFAFLEYLFDHRYFIYNNYIPSWQLSSFFPSSMSLENQTLPVDFRPFLLFPHEIKSSKPWSNPKRKRTIINTIGNEYLYSNQYGALPFNNSRLRFYPYRLLNKNVNSESLTNVVHSNQQSMGSHFYRNDKQGWLNELLNNELSWTKENYPLYFTTSDTLLKTLTWRFLKKIKQTRLSKIWPWLIQGSIEQQGFLPISKISKTGKNHFCEANYFSLKENNGRGLSKYKAFESPQTWPVGFLQAKRWGNLQKMDKLISNDNSSVFLKIPPSLRLKETNRPSLRKNYYDFRWSKLNKESEKTVSSNRLLASMVSILNTINFRDILFERFMNAKFYDIGLMGRKRLNKKLRLNVPLQCTTLTPLDFLAIFYKLFSLYNNFSLIQNSFPTRGETPLTIPFLGDSFALNSKVNPWSNSQFKMHNSSGSLAFRQLMSTNIKGATLPLATPGVGNVVKPRNSLLDSTIKQTGSLDHLNQRHIRTSGEFLFLQFWRAILRFYQVLSQLSSRSNFIKSSYIAAGKTGRNFFSLSSISLFPYIEDFPMASAGGNLQPEPELRFDDQIEYILPVSNNQTHILKAYGYFNPTNLNNDTFNFNSYQYQCFQNTMSGEFIVNSNGTTVPPKITGSSPNNYRSETLNIVINRNDINSILPYTPYFQVSSIYDYIKKTQPRLIRVNEGAQKIISTCASFQNFILKQNQHNFTRAEWYKIFLNKINNRQNSNNKSMVDNFILISPKYFMEEFKNKKWYSQSEIFQSFRSEETYSRSLTKSEDSEKTNSYFSNPWVLKKGFLKSFDRRLYRANLIAFKTFFNKYYLESHKLWTNQVKKSDFLEGIMTLKSVPKFRPIIKLNSKQVECLVSVPGFSREKTKNEVSSLNKPAFSSKIETIIQKLLYETKELRVYDAKERMRNLETKLFNGVFKEFFNLDPLSQDLDETNGLSEIIHKRRISALGKGGVTSKNAPLSIRSIHPSFYGRLCPIDSPEGDRVGLINSLTNYARINSIGYIATPFYRTRNQNDLQFYEKYQKLSNSNESELTNQYYEKSILPPFIHWFNNKNLKTNNNYDAKTISFTKPNQETKADLREGTSSSFYSPMAHNRLGLYRNMFSDKHKVLPVGFQQSSLFQKKQNRPKQWGNPKISLLGQQPVEFTLLAKKLTLQMRMCPPIAFFGKIYSSSDLYPSVRLSYQDMIYDLVKTKEIIKWNNYRQSYGKQIVFNLGSANIERTYKYFMKSSFLRPYQIKNFRSKTRFLGTKPILGNSFIYKSTQASPVSFFQSFLEQRRQNGPKQWRDSQNYFKSKEISDFQEILGPMPSFGLNKTQQRGLAYSDFMALPGKLKENVQNDFSYTNPNSLMNKDNQKIPRKLELFLFYDTHYMTPPITHRETIINNAKDKNMGHIYTPFLTCYFDFVSFQGYAPITAFQFFSPGVGLIPFLEHDDGTRALMGANMQRQAVPLISASQPIVGTGLEKNIAASFIISSCNSGYLYYISGKQSKQIFTSSQFPTGGREPVYQFNKIHDFKNSSLSKPIIEKTQFLSEPPIKYFVPKTTITSTEKTVWKPYHLDLKPNPISQTNSFFCWPLAQNRRRLYAKTFPYKPETDRRDRTQLKHRTDLCFRNLNRLKSTKISKIQTGLRLFKKINKNKEGHHFVLNTHWLPYRKSYKATIINKKPAIFENSWLQKGDLLVDGTSSLNGELALGRNLFSIYMPWEGYNFEDAILISDKAAESYTTIHVEEFSVKISKNEFVSSVVKPSTWVNLGDILVSKKRKLENEFIMNRLLFGMSSKPNIKNLDNDFYYDPLSNYNLYGDKPFSNSQKTNALYNQKTFNYMILPFYNHTINKLDNKKRDQYPYFNNLKSRRVTDLNQLKIETLKDKNNDLDHFFFSKNKPVYIRNNNNGLIWTRTEPHQKVKITGELLNDFSQLRSPLYKVTISEETSFLTQQRSITDNQNDINTVSMLRSQPIGSQILSPLEQRRPEIKRQIESDDKLSSSFVLNEKGERVLTPPSSLGMSLKKNDNFEIDTSYRTGESICGWVISVKSQSPISSFHNLKDSNVSNIDKSKIEIADQKHVNDSKNTPLVQKSTAERSEKTSNENTHTINNESKMWPLSKPIIDSYTGSIQKFLSLLSIFHKNVEFKNNVFHNIQEPSIKLFTNKKTKSYVFQPNFGFSKKIHPLGYQSLKNIFKTSNYTYFKKPNNTFLKWSQNYFKNESLKQLFFNLPSSINHQSQSAFIFRNPDSVPRVKTESTPLKITNDLKQQPGADTIYIYVAVAKPLQVGDKISGRHGNKGIISKILPFYDMPYLIDGTPIDIVLNPLGVPSRMNVGQIYESLLGLTGFYKHEYYRLPPFDENYSSQFSRNFVYWKLNELKDLHFFKSSQTGSRIFFTSPNSTNNLTPLSAFLSFQLRLRKKPMIISKIGNWFNILNDFYFFPSFYNNPCFHLWKKGKKKAFKLLNCSQEDKMYKAMGCNPKRTKTQLDFYMSKRELLDESLEKSTLNLKTITTVDWNTSLLWYSQFSILRPLKNFLKLKSSKIISINNISSYFENFSMALARKNQHTKPQVYMETGFYTSTADDGAGGKEKSNGQISEFSKQWGRLELLGNRSNQVTNNFKFYSQNNCLNTSFLSNNTLGVEKFGLNPYFPGKMRLLNGLTGETFYRPIIVGKSYMLKLIHLVHHKIHARATGPYALITQQPLKGKRNQGGQRMGEMEIWALYGFGSASILYEMLTIKSDDPVGRERILREIAGLKGNNVSNLNWRNNEDSSILSLRESNQFVNHYKSTLGERVNDSLEKGISESFRVLVMNLRALCLDMQVFKDLAN